MGISPIKNTGGSSVDRASELDKALGESSSNQSEKPTIINTVAQPVAKQFSNIGNDMATEMQNTGQDVINNTKRALGSGPADQNDEGSFGANFAGDLTARLASLGHIAGDTLISAFTPLTTTLSALIPPDIKEGADQGVNWLADKITNNPQALKLLQAANHIGDTNPDLATAITKDIPAVLGVIGGDEAHGANPDVSIAEAKNTLGTIKDDATSVLNSAKKNIVEPVKSSTPVLESTPVDQNIFKENLNNAEQSIYGKLTPTEKGSIKLRDEKGVFGTKSVPDFQGDPKTRPIIESVANLPDDIKLNPTDSIATRESKLDQGAKRLHQGNESALGDPQVKTQTTFKPEDYDAFMKERVLDPIEKEFGDTSVEYAEAQKAIESSKKTLKSNDAEGVYKGRQKFSSNFESENPRTFKKAKGSFGAELDPKTTATVEGGREVYTAMNDFTEQLLPENHPLRARMKEESNLIRAKQEMRTRNTSDLGKSSTRRYLDRHPVLNKSVDFAKGALKVGTGVDLIK